MDDLRSPTDTRTCTIDGCSKLLLARGWCAMHYDRARKYGDPLAEPRLIKFWKQVDRRGPDECWLWRGCHSGNKQGYGVFGAHPQVLVHRYAYELLVGPIPAGSTLDHICHNDDVDCPGGLCIHRLCCNPRHLEPVLGTENVRRGKTSRRFCRNGHDRLVVGVYVDPRGWQHCLACHRAAHRRWQGGAT